MEAKYVEENLGIDPKFFSSNQCTTLNQLLLDIDDWSNTFPCCLLPYCMPRAMDQSVHWQLVLKFI
jgi:hypothetical protein